MLIKVKAFPDWFKEEVIKKSDDSFEVYVKEKPVNGLANRRIVTLLANYFKIEESKLRLVKGGKERSKIFEILE